MMKCEEAETILKCNSTTLLEFNKEIGIAADTILSELAYLRSVNKDMQDELKHVPSRWEE